MLSNYSLKSYPGLSEVFYDMRGLIRFTPILDLY